MGHRLHLRCHKCRKWRELSQQKTTSDKERGRWHSGWRCIQYSRYAHGRRDMRGGGGKEGRMVEPVGAGDTAQVDLGEYLAVGKEDATGQEVPAVRDGHACSRHACYEHAC